MVSNIAIIALANFRDVVESKIWVSFETETDLETPPMRGMNWAVELQNILRQTIFFCDT